MKKNIFYVGALFLGLILGTSCSEEDGLVKNKQTLVEATINNPASRTTVSSEYKVVWSQGDAYTVWSSEDTKKGDLTLTTGEGSTTGSFTGTLNPALANGDVALFPSVSGKSKSYTFKSEYTTTETDAPMLGTYNGTSFSFNHLAAFIRVNANDLPAGNAVLTIKSANQALTGEATLTAEKVLIPSGEDKIITVTFTAEEGQELVFDAPIPAQAYDKITLTLKVGETEIFQKERALNAVVGNLYELTSTKQMTVEEANDVLEGLEDNKSLNVNISAPNNNATITVPAAEGSVLNMDISNVSDGASITINNNESVSVGESQQNIGVNVANDESSAIDMTINTPTATVEVGKGYFTTVTATTATNTLIVGKGVTITKLVVAAGNVRIEGGKITTSITNDNDNEVVYVIADQTDADTYKELSNNVKASITKIECASDIWVEVNTASGLYAASLGAKNIKLGADITITADKPVNPKNGQIYDLNGKKVAVATTGAKDVFRIVEAGAVVTIKNGTIDNQTGNNYALSVRADNVTLNMEGVTIPANSYDGSLHKNGNYTGSTVSLTNCNFNGVVYLSNTDDKTANTLNVSGGSFASATQNCFELLNTNATISGATLTNTLEEQKYTANGNSGNSFSNPQGYCIAFTNNDGKAAKGSATLSDNTYSVADENGSYIFNQMNGATLNMEVSRFKEFAEVAAAGGEIKLQNDIEDAVGLSINKDLTVDFNDNTYTISKPGAGSAGTQTLGFQLLKGNDIIFKNGTIECSVANKEVTWASNATEKGIAMMIQNYANLTLESMTIDGTNIAHNGNNTRYIVSSNSGTVNLKGATSITAIGKDVAFDVCKYADYPAPEVNVETDGTIQGLVEVSGGTLNVETGTFKNEAGHCVKVITGTADFSGGTFNAQEVAVFNMVGNVNITGGVFTSNDNAVISGNGTNETKYQDGTINISGGTFNANIQSKGYVACGIYHPQRGTLKVTGGTFNVENGCGILMRGGSLDMTGSEATFNCTGNSTGKVGDSRVVVPCGKNIVKDAYSAYYDAENITIEGVDEQEIYNVVNQQ